MANICEYKPKLTGTGRRGMIKNDGSGQDEFGEQQGW